MLDRARVRLAEPNIVASASLGPASLLRSSDASSRRLLLVRGVLSTELRYGVAIVLAGEEGSLEEDKNDFGLLTSPRTR